MNVSRKTIVIDAGNSHTKAKLIDPASQWVESVSFASVVSKLTTEEAQALAHNPDPLEGKGFVFAFGGEQWVVGDMANAYSGKTPVKGGARYENEEWQVLIAAAIAALAPGSGDFNLFVAIPLRGHDLAQQSIQQDLRRKWQVRIVDPSVGGNVGAKTVDVRRVETMHETEGAYFFYMLDADGQPRTDSFFRELHQSCDGGMNGLHQYGAIIGDGGGWSWDSLPITSLKPDYRRARTIRGEIGLNNVIIWLEDALQANGALSGSWADERLRGALIPSGYTKSGSPQFQIRVGRKKVNAKGFVETAVSRLTDEVAEQLLTELRGGREHVFMFLTGGAAEAVYPWMQRALREKASELGVESHIIVLKPDTSEPPYFHNVEGMVRYLRRKWAKQGN